MLAISGRIGGEVKQFETVAPGQARTESGLRDRRLRYPHAEQPHPSATAPTSVSTLMAWHGPGTARWPGRTERLPVGRQVYDLRMPVPTLK